MQGTGDAKRALHDVMYAPTKTDAETAIGAFVAEFEVKYPKATACLVEDQEPLLTLLLSRRALDAPADDEPDRVAVRDGPAAAASDEGCGLPDEGPADGLQDGPAAMEAVERRAPATAGARRGTLRRWRHAGTRPDGDGGSEGSRLPPR